MHLSLHQIFLKFSILPFVIKGTVFAFYANKFRQRENKQRGSKEVDMNVLQTISSNQNLNFPVNMWMLFSMNAFTIIFTIIHFNTTFLM